VRGGLAVASIYLVTSIGAADENMAILWELSAWIRACTTPVILCGDFNMDPKTLWATGWPSAMGLTLFFPDAPTCGEACLDFFVISVALAKYVLGVRTLDLGTRPHWAVELRLAGRPAQEWQQVMAWPRPLPLDKPLNAPLPLPPGAAALAEPWGKDSSALTKTWRMVCSRLEIGVLAAHGIQGEEAQPYLGHGECPRLVWQPIVDRDAGPLPRTTAEGVAARRLLARIADAATCMRRHGAPSPGVLKKLRACDGSDLGARWPSLKVQIRAPISLEWLGEAKLELEALARKCDAQAAAARAKQWREYAVAMAAQGARAAHAFIKVKTTSIYSQFGDVLVGAQERAELLADEWGAGDRWAAVGQPVPDPHDWSGIQFLPKPTPAQMRAVCKTFRKWTGLGIDHFHMRAYECLSDDELQLFIDFMYHVECVGVLPEQLDWLIMVFIPKATGGVRPIGLLPGPLRVWMRVRKYVVRIHAEKHRRAYHAGLAGHTCTQASWSQAVQDELAAARGLVSGSVILDVHKCFEAVKHHHLFREASFLLFPWVLLRLDLAVARSGRRCRLGLACSRALWSPQTIVAGSSNATVLLQLYMLRCLDRVCTGSPLAQVRNVVDDISIQVVGEVGIVRDTLKKATMQCVNGLTSDDPATGLDLMVHPEKAMVLSASDDLLRQLAGDWGLDVDIPAADATKLLGADYAAARRRSATVRRGRLEEFDSRRRRTTMLKDAGVDVSSLVDVGSVAGAMWGCAIDGIAPTVLHRMRQLCGHATAGVAWGRSLTLDLALGPGSDPFIRSVVEPVTAWAEAVWTLRLSIRDLQVAVWSEALRLAPLKHPWQAVRGPVGAFLLSAARGGWHVGNCITLVKGSRTLRMDRTPPAAIAEILSREARDVLWGQLGKQPGLAGLGAPAIGPIRRLLARKCCSWWSMAHKVALRSIFIGSQWPQERLFQCGLADTPLCCRCREAPGSLLHRAWRCPATAGWRAQALRESDLVGLDVKEGVASVFLERAIAPSLHHLLPAARQTPWVKQLLAPPGGLYTGDVFVDGSGSHPGDKLRRRVGAGISMRTPDGVEVGAAYAAAPLLVQTTPGAEAYAVYLVLEMATVPLRLHTDCADVVAGFERGRAWACDPRRAQAAIWCAIWTLLEEFTLGEGGVTILKVAAHTTAADVRAGRITRFARAGNARADQLAKMGAALHPTDLLLERVWPVYEHRVLQVAQHLAEATALLQREGRDSTGRLGPRKRAELIVVDDAPEVVDAAKVRAIAAQSDLAAEEAPRPHRLHVSTMTSGPDVVHCAFCGAFTSAGRGGQVRLLARPCDGPTTGMHNQRRRIRLGQHPHAAGAHGRARMVSTKPVSAEALATAAGSRVATGASHPTIPAASAAPGPSLEAAMRWVGISLQDLPRLEKAMARRQRARAVPGLDDSSDDDGACRAADEVGDHTAGRQVGPPLPKDIEEARRRIGTEGAVATRRGRFKFEAD